MAQELLFTLPLGEKRENHFLDVHSSLQQEMYEKAKKGAELSILVNRLDRQVDIEEFKKICQHIQGKPKTFYKVARENEVSVFGRQAVIGGFDSTQEKRIFTTLFKMLYPDYWAHEISRYVKFFFITHDEVPDIDWKEFFTRTFKSAFKSCSVISGAEALASDYKLLKDPIMNPLKTLRAV